MSTLTRLFAATVVFSFFSSLHMGSSAQTYPAKPVTFIVPFPPGGGTDISARTVAAKLTQKWGQSVIAENRAGAAGILGADAAAKARPDGYTLLIVNVGVTSINPTLYPKLPYDPDKAFAPISLLCELPFVLMASPSFKPSSVKELVALAKANPDKVTFASSGQGGSPHLTAEIFQLATGTRLTHVPYKGGGPAMTDLMAGHVDLLFA
jgi:tripartite-type tricarboxylate transporter receptor subunit TctC